MRWTIMAVGKLKEAHFLAGVAEYLKRLGPYRPVEVVEVPDEKIEPGLRGPQAAEREGQAMRREADRILNAVRPGAFLVALTERGEQIDSLALARRLEACEHEGHRELVFVLGGANGLDRTVLDRADWTLGLSRLTLPHQLARVFLLEQLYRAERIRRGEPYHR